MGEGKDRPVREEKKLLLFNVSGKFGQMSDVFMMGQVVSLCVSNYSLIIVL